MPIPSYSHGASDTPLLGDTIGVNFERAAARFADRPALISRGQEVRLTYAQLDAAIDAAASGLLRAGIRAGDRIGIWAPNCAEWLLVQYATAKIGAILVNINPAYRVHELEYVLREAGVRLLFSASTFKTSDYAAMIDEVSPGIGTLERTVFVDRPEWDELCASEPDRDAIAARMASLSFDDPINIQYTSGTTGFPKGATLSHHNLLNNGFFVTELLALTEQDVTCLPVPLYHCFGMVMGNLGTLAHGGCVVLPAPSFEPRATLEAVEAEGVTSLYGVPTMFIAMLGHEDFDSFDLSSLRTGIMAGSPCPIEVMKTVVDRMHMTEVAICYGMTETSPVSTQTRVDDPLERRVSTVGRAAPHVEIKVIDPETSLVVERGEPGELCTRGYSVMLGYWPTHPTPSPLTAEAVDGAGWMRTGDLATMDDDGYLNIVGRSKDMIIRGGENIYPRELEEFLYEHDDIVDVQVVGVPDEKYGEELCAWVRLKPGADLDEDAVREFCRARLAHFKVPRYVIFADEFPLTITGKVQKFKMRDASIDRLALQGAAGVRNA
ncbi:MAG TPA: AMP-binding protein [Solirubrobacteraceae bacterium]|nr:AMP-binding protein [Solirubrobacteraceae bacterium]